jgi:hypothetical protein
MFSGIQYQVHVYKLRLSALLLHVHIIKTVIVKIKSRSQ